MQTFGASAPLKELLRQVRLHRRTTSMAAAKAAARPQGVTAMPNPLQGRCNELRPVGLARLHQPRACSTSGELKQLIARGRAARRHLEPVDLREGDRPAATTTTTLIAAAAEAAGDLDAGALYEELAIARHPGRPPTCCARSTTQTQRPRRLRQPRGLALSRACDTARARSTRRGGCGATVGRAQPDDQGARRPSRACRRSAR